MRFILIAVLSLSSLFAQAPASAVPIGPFFDVPGVISAEKVKQAALASVRDTVDRDNAVEASTRKWLCENWTIKATHERAIGAPISEKPEMTASQVVNFYEGSGVTYVWLTPGKPVWVCPDLPPVPPPPPPGTVAIGKRLSKTIWQALPGDTVEIGERRTITTPDGVTGEFERLGSPFGGHWLFIK